MALLTRLAAGGLLLLMALAALDGKPAPTAPSQLPEKGQQRTIDLVADDNDNDGGSDQVANSGDSCFGHKIDRIGSVSGLGCNKALNTRADPEFLV